MLLATVKIGDVLLERPKCEKEAWLPPATKSPRTYTVEAVTASRIRTVSSEGWRATFRREDGRSVGGRVYSWVRLQDGPESTS